MSDTKKLMTPEATLSFPHLFVPQAAEDGGIPKYSCSLVFSPEAQQTPEFQALRAAAVAAAKEKWGDKAAEKLKSARYKTFRDDVAAKGYPEGSVFINVRSTYAPGIVRWDKSLITEADKAEVYPGAIVRAIVSAFAYERKGNHGVSFGLDGLQKLRDGERLDGRVNVQDAFDATEPPAAVDFSDIADEGDDGSASVDANDELAGLL